LNKKRHLKTFRGCLPNRLIQVFDEELYGKKI
jgi:hypothetical protein